MIPQRMCGPTGARVSTIGFGGAAISGEGGGYGFGPISEKEAGALLHAAVDAGVTVFDAAPVYGFRLCEQRMGRVFAGMRQQVFLVSKCGVTWSPARRITIDNRPEVVTRMLEQSLKDLRTDYIDLYMIHWPDPRTDIRKPMGCLARALEQGKIRWLGLCNCGAEDLRRASEVHSIAVLQNQFNLFDDSARDRLFGIIREKKLGFMGWGTFDKGVLTGRVTPHRTFSKTDARSWAPWWKREDRAPKFRAMQRIRCLLKHNGHSALELALGYVLQFEELSTALCGIRNLKQLRACILALKNLPGRQLLEQARAIAAQELAASQKTKSSETDTPADTRDTL